jgi:hypothetical protein
MKAKLSGPRQSAAGKVAIAKYGRRGVAFFLDVYYSSLLLDNGHISYNYPEKRNTC